MRDFKRRLLTICLAVAFSVLLGAVTVSAKSYTPAKVTGLSAKAAESIVTLTWKKASGATGYEIYMKTGSSGKYKKIITTNKTSYTKTKLTNGKTYYFRIRSICSTGKKKYYSTSYSKVVKAKPTVKAVAAPSGFKTYQSGNGKVYLSWDTVSNATGYAVYQYDSGKKAYKKIATTKNRTCTVSGLTNGKQYKFRVKSYRKVGSVTRYSSKYSSTVTATPEKLTTSVSSVRPIYYKATVTSTVTASPASSGSKKQTVKKGTQVTVTTYGSTCKVKLSNGQQVYISLSKLNFTSSLYTTKSYSKSLKEAFVNQKGYSSRTKYLIWVSTYTQEYCLYTGSRGNWRLLRTAKVATGKASTPTSTHICSITRKEEAWTYEGGRYQAPVVYFYGNNAFHSRLHNADGTIASATIGKPVSGGCIRMYDEDIQYIYKNCPIGTTVVIY